MRLHIRWMIRRDLPEVMAIENCSNWPLTEETFIRALRERNCIGLVAESQDKAIVGFMVYFLHPGVIQVFNFAVHPRYRRLGIGRQMIAKLYAKLSSHRRTELVMLVRESDLPFHLFLRSQGFKARAVTREHYDDTGEDAYDFRLDYAPEYAEAQTR